MIFFYFHFSATNQVIKKKKSRYFLLFLNSIEFQSSIKKRLETIPISNFGVDQTAMPMNKILSHEAAWGKEIMAGRWNHIMKSLSIKIKSEFAMNQPVAELFAVLSFIHILLTNWEITIIPLPQFLWTSLKHRT